MLTFIETRLFTRLFDELFSDDALVQLQEYLSDDPEAGNVIPNSGGIRKLRWAASGRGKRGGLRIIYYFRAKHGQIWLLTLYSKSEATRSRSKFSGRSKRKSMMRTERIAPRRKRNVGREILTGIQELKRGEHGRVTTVPSVQQIRRQTGLSQSRFAQLLGVSSRTLQEWEQGRRAPSGAARTLLLIAAKNPQALLDVS